MRKNLVCILILFLLMFPSLYSTFGPVEVQASNGYPIHNLDTALNYTTIQEAIYAPETDAGDTILADAGTYYENVEVNKSVSLVGEDKETTIVDGNGVGIVFYITADDVNISEFTVTNSGAEGIGVGSRYCNIYDNVVSFAGERGISLGGGNHSVHHNILHHCGMFGVIDCISDNNTVFNNIAHSSPDAWGISINMGDNNFVFNNTVYSNGLGFHLDWSATNNMLYDNTVFDNDEGLFVHQSSNNNSIIGNNITNNGFGILLESSSSNTISGNSITDNNQGIRLDGSSNHNSISGNDIASNGDGIYLGGSSNNSISGNTVTNNDYGIRLSGSSNNSILGNNITANNDTGVIINYGDNNSFLDNTIFDNFVGFSLQSSNNNTLSDNQMTNNTFNFAVGGSSLSHFLHDIDPSNTVNGKPMYYWVNEENREIPNDAGYVALVNSRGITVQDLNLTHNAQGVLLAYTTESTVKNVTAEFNGIGIALQSSYDNTLIGNVASNNMQYGIALSDSGGNILRNNTMTANIINFGVIPGPMPTPSTFINDVDPSNKVDGKPIYYWVNQSNRHIPSDAGYVLVVNSTGITVSNLTLTNNVFGVGLIYSIDSLVRNVTVQNNMMGVALGWCVNTLVEECNVADNAQCGFVVMASMNSNLTHNWVSGHRFVSGPEGGPLGGFSVLFSNTTTIANNTIGDNSYGIALANSHHNKVLWNSIENNENGISLQYSDGNELTWNRVANNTEGIQLQESNANVVTHNNITSNMNSGLDLANSGGNTLRNNSLADNKWNFGIWGDTLSDFINDVDTSNTVNGNPIVYLINQTNLIISPATFSQVGCLVLVNSMKVTVQSLTLANNYESLTLAYTHDSEITNITATNNVVSLLLWASNNNTITANTMRDSWFGPLLGRSNDNKLANNNITNNSQGIGLFNESHNNTLIGNFVRNNSYGIFLRASEENTLYHNNFINNTNQADIEESFNNTWDNGLEGNYWSDYTGADLDKDGIADSPHFVSANNTDHYPLMGMFSSFYATSEYHVQTICNSTISDFQFNGTAISFNVSGEDVTSGFCRILIPTALMNDAFTIYVNGANTSYSLLPCSNSTHSCLYFNYTLSTKEIVIIPEFPSIIIMPLFMIATLLAAVLLKKKKHPSARRIQT